MADDAVRAVIAQVYAARLAQAGLYDDRIVRDDPRSRTRKTF
jgi:hypothetical protein